MEEQRSCKAPVTGSSPVTSSIIGSPEYWRARAGEARAVAEQGCSSVVKSTMYEIAESYEQMAERAARYLR
jgi:hypothetical protein